MEPAFGEAVHDIDIVESVEIERKDKGKSTVPPYKAMTSAMKAQAVQGRCLDVAKACPVRALPPVRRSASEEPLIPEEPPAAIDKAMTFIADIKRKDKGDIDEGKDNRWGKDDCKSDWWESDWWESGRWESSCPDNRWGKDDCRSGWGGTYWMWDGEFDKWVPWHYEDLTAV